MTPPGFLTEPSRQSYDIVIIGGGIMGSSTAWHLTQDPGFNGSVLVIEKDPSFEFSSTARTNSCMRQQFSTELNIRMSQFAAEFIKTLPERMGDPEAPRLDVQSFGYMYLADTEAFADVLRRNQKTQIKCGAATQLMTPDQIKAAYPFYHTDDLVLGSINLVDEGYWDGALVFDWLQRKARDGGAEYVVGEVTDIATTGDRVQSVTLANGQKITCGQLVNASGPRAAVTAAMAGITLRVEPRKRFTWIFKAETPLDRPLPLTIDPSGVHWRENGGGTYLAGGHTAHDPAVPFDDFEMDHNFWQDHVWPVIATRIPQFEAIKLTSEWAGHYATNTLDHNAIIGPHPEIRNFIFLNGFSGHGLQQSPAMGRGTAEWLVHGAYQTLDLTPFHYDRITENRPIQEDAVI